MAKRLAVIGGGTGFVGRAIGLHLQKTGYDVKVLSRVAQSSSCLSWDDLKSNGLPRGTEVVINLAGRNIGDPKSSWNDAYKSEVWTSRIDTTKTLADAIQKAEVPPSLFMSASAIGYYTPDVNKEYIESDPGGHDTVNWFSKLCGHWEAAAQLPDNSPTRSCILRFGVVLGRDGGMISNIFWPFYLGVGGSMGPGDHWLSWVHIDDVVKMTAHIINQQSVSGPINIVAPNPVPYKEFVGAFAGALGRPALLNTPTPVVRWLFGAERADQLILASTRVMPDKLKKSGFHFQYANITDACTEFARRPLTETENERRAIF